MKTKELERKHGFPCDHCGAETFSQSAELCRGGDCPSDAMGKEVFDTPTVSKPDLIERVSPSCLLNAVQMAYRKHHMDDESIGWEELDQILFDALCNSMGDCGYQKWMSEMAG